MGYDRFTNKGEVMGRAIDMENKLEYHEEMIQKLQYRIDELDKISKTEPHFTSNSLYRFKETPTYSRVTSLNRLKTLTMNKNIKNIKNDFLLNIN